MAPYNFNLFTNKEKKIKIRKIKLKSVDLKMREYVID